MSVRPRTKLRWTRKLLFVVGGCWVFFQGPSLQAQDDKPTVVSLLDVSPSIINVGSADTSLTLRFRANDPQVALPLVPTEYQVEWGGTQRVTLPVNKVSPPVSGVYTLEFTVSPGLTPLAEAVTLTLLVKLPGSGGRSVPSNSINLSVVPPSPLNFDVDFDGDRTNDIAVYRDGVWIIRRSSDGGETLRSWGVAQDVPIPADYDGDGKTDIAVYRNGTWIILRSLDEGTTVTNFGPSPQDVPVPGDYDGDGKTDIAIYRDGTWLILRSSDGVVTVTGWGAPQDIPLN